MNETMNMHDVAASLYDLVDGDSVALNEDDRGRLLKAARAAENAAKYQKFENDRAKHPTKSGANLTDWRRSADSTEVTVDFGDLIEEMMSDLGCSTVGELLDRLPELLAVYVEEECERLRRQAERTKRRRRRAAQ